MIRSPASPARRAIDVPTNLAVCAGIGAVNLFVLFTLPLWLLPAAPAWGFSILLLVPLTITHWAAIHEAIHGSLHPERARNHRLGRLLCLLYGSPFHVVRFGHLSHHSLNGRDSERPEVFAADQRSRWLVRCLYYGRLTFGLYAAEAGSGPLSLLPAPAVRALVRRAFYEGKADSRNMAQQAERYLLEPARRRETRMDAALIIALYATSFWLYGALWPWLVAAIALRAFTVSVMDNAPHYGGDLDDWGQGYDLRLPWPLTLLVLNSNLHGTHHRHPNVPWQQLPATFERDGRRLGGSYLLAPWRQFRGPLVREECPQDPTTAEEQPRRMAMT